MTARRSFGVVRIAVALLLVASIATQIVDQLANGAFVPSEYFSYFTIQTSLMDVIVLLVAGVFALRSRQDGELFTGLRMALVSYAAVTGSVYAALLRGTGSSSYDPIPWPNEVIHVAVPIYLALDWLLTPGRSPVAWKRLWLAVAYPLAWLALTLLRGILTGWYPYPFLLPDGPGGWPSVFLYVLAITVFILGIAIATIAVSRLTRAGGASAMVADVPSTGSGTE